ncbi:MAG: hypothetical protein QXQ50_09310 [Candidatus Bathyarchaeia archaeon]
MQNSQNSLIQLLTTNPEYRKNYIKYKVHVEHRKPSTKLMKALPYEVAVELENLWEKELYEYLKPKKHAKTNAT